MKHGGRLRRAVLALGVGLTAAAASLPLAGAAEPGPAAPAPGVRAPGVADGRFSAGACPVPMPVKEAQ